MEAGKDPLRSFQPTCLRHLEQCSGWEPEVSHQAQDRSVVHTMRSHISIKVGREEEIEQLCAVSLVLRCSSLLITNLDTIFLHTTHGAIEKQQISRFVGFIYRSIQGIDDLLRGLVIPSLPIRRHSKHCGHSPAQ